MEATMLKKGLLFELSNGILKVAVAIDAEGEVEYLLYTVGRGPTRRFTREEISAAVSEQGTRARVVLENGAADGPIVRFTVIVPPIVGADEAPFKVDAAALRSTQNSLFGGPRPGPQVTYETIDLAGTVSCAATTDADTARA
jgi:hypothetical protein